MMRAACAVLHGLIDYAGLFPPAGLTMAVAVANYAAYQRRAEHWALGRFVAPAARLEEFIAALDALPEGERFGARWPIAALAGPDLPADVERIEAFNERFVHGGPEVQSLEARVVTEDEVRSIGVVVPPRYEVYLELPLSETLPRLVQAARNVGARAKIRTGGVRQEDFPAAEAVLAFLVATAAARAPFKATAGLHHPVRGVHPLTYQAGSACATMFGYLNVVLAATVVWHRRPPGDALRLLLAEDRVGLLLGEDRIRWEGLEIGVDEVGRARREFVRAIGSCSFTEPIEEIEQ
jgi:hypothetical protein